MNKLLRIVAGLNLASAVLQCVDGNFALALLDFSLFAIMTLLEKSP